MDVYLRLLKKQIVAPAFQVGRQQEGATAQKIRAPFTNYPVRTYRIKYKEWGEQIEGRVLAVLEYIFSTFS